jgi:hypothetical protein
VATPAIATRRAGFPVKHKKKSALGRDQRAEFSVAHDGEPHLDVAEVGLHGSRCAARNPREQEAACLSANSHNTVGETPTATASEVM